MQKKNRNVSVLCFCNKNARVQTRSLQIIKDLMVAQWHISIPEAYGFEVK